MLKVGQRVAAKEGNIPEVGKLGTIREVREQHPYLPYVVEWDNTPGWLYGCCWTHSAVEIQAFEESE